jgi:hypothetical protein
VPHLNERGHDVGARALVQQVLPLFLPQRVEAARCEHELNRVEKV